MPKDFTHDILITWADCDQARIVFTGNIPSLALKAIDAFWIHATGGHGWYQFEIDHNFGTPFVHINMNLRKPVTPRHILNCKVWPCGLGTTSVKFRVEGWQNGELCWEGFFICVVVQADTFKKMPPPKLLSDALAPYMRPDHEKA